MSRVFSSLSKHFSAAHLSQFVGLVEATCSVRDTYIHNCCSRACCIPTYMYSARPVFEASSSCRTTSQPCLFRLLFLFKKHSCLTLFPICSRFVQSEMPAALEVFCLCSEILICTYFVYFEFFCQHLLFRESMFSSFYFQF